MVSLFIGHERRQRQLQERMQRDPAGIDCRHTSRSRHYEIFGGYLLQLPQKSGLSRPGLTRQEYVRPRLFHKRKSITLLPLKKHIAR